MMNTTYKQLIDNLEYLKMNNMVLNLNDTINFINKNQLSFADGLIKLTAYEIDSKEKALNNSMVKVGAFPLKRD